MVEKAKKEVENDIREEGNKQLLKLVFMVFILKLLDFLEDLNIELVMDKMY